MDLKSSKKSLDFFFFFSDFPDFFEWTTSRIFKNRNYNLKSRDAAFLSNSKFDERINCMPSDEVTCSKGGSEQVVGSGRLIELGPQGGGRWRRSLGGGRSFGREADEGRRWRRGQSAARTRRESDAEGQQRRKGRR